MKLCWVKGRAWREIVGEELCFKWLDWGEGDFVAFGFSCERNFFCACSCRIFDAACAREWDFVERLWFERFIPVEEDDGCGGGGERGDDEVRRVVPQGQVLKG